MRISNFNSNEGIALKFFEVRRRDGAARLGLFMESIPTPAALKIQQLKELLNDIKYKYKLLPLRIPKEVFQNYKIYKDIYRSAYKKDEAIKEQVAVIHPLCIEKRDEAWLYIIGSAIQLNGDARAFIDTVIQIRETIPADAALYAPALATPENAAILIYCGIDLIDEILSIFLAYKDIYLTQEGEYTIEDLNELPCSCAICKDLSAIELKAKPKIDRAELIASHNCLKLEEELKKIRELIRKQTLREYIEGKCRTSPWLTAAVRLLDHNYSYLEERTPIARKTILKANSREALNRVEVKRFAERVKTRYRSPSAAVLLLLPCSAKKPYSTSPSHSKFIEALGRYRAYVHQVIITSPLGVVPRELEIVYPAAHYDTAVTGIWDLDERSWVEACLYDFLKTNEYERIIAHVDGTYAEICRNAASRLNLEVEFTFIENERLTSKAALANLSRAIARAMDEIKELRSISKLDIIRAIACYQFGINAGRALIQESTLVRGSFPKWQIIDGGKQLAALNPQTGLLSLSIDGGRRIEQFGYKVEIDAFLPKGLIFTPGIINADRQIREGDEVVVKGSKAFGVGRALMGSWEMLHSRKGAAVELRHVVEL